MTFLEALELEDLKSIRTFPKSDLHSHCGLGMRFDVFENYCGTTIKKPPKKMNGLADLDDYMFNVTQSYVDHLEGFEFSVEATIQAAIESGVTLLVTSLDVSNMFYYENPDAYFSFIRKMIKKYESVIDFKPEIGLFKGLNESWYEAIETCIQSRVFYSIDFYGDESIINIPFFKKFIDLAKAYHLVTKMHIGEFCTSEIMFDVIKACEPDEIQHGIQAYDHEALMAYIKEKGITLHVCPTSNVVLGAVPSLEEHPIKILVEKGIKVTINTDDLLIFNSGVSEEYLKLYQSKTLTASQLDEIRIGGLKLEGY